MSDDFMTEDQFCEAVGISESNAQHMRYRGEGPAFYKIGRLIRYRRVDVESWIESRRVATSEVK